MSLTYGRPVPEPPLLEEAIALEGSDGDISRGEIYTFVVKRSWFANALGCRPVDYCDLPKYCDDQNDAHHSNRSYFQYPVFDFLWKDAQIIYSEFFGPRYICRKRGTLKSGANYLRIVDVRVLWIAYVDNAPPCPKGIIPGLELELGVEQ